MVYTRMRVLVRRDGALLLSKRDQARLKRFAGVHAEIRLPQPSRTTTDTEHNPLLAMIGMFDGGKTDGATNHDAYLYQEPTA